MAEATPSTQEQLDVADIMEGIVILKSGGAAMVIQTNAVNFDLLSEKEQDAMIGAYSTFLNSLSSHIQVLVRSRRLDISTYLKRVDEAAKTQPNPYLLKRITAYREFVKELVQKKEVLDKRFFIIIPYFEAMPSASSVVSPFQRLLGMKPKSATIDRVGVLQRAKTDLEPKRDNAIKQLGRLGIKAQQLTTTELVKLFYEIYNPEQAGTQHLEEGAARYTAPMVEPALQQEYSIPDGGAPSPGLTNGGQEGETEQHV